MNKNISKVNSILKNGFQQHLYFFILLLLVVISATAILRNFLFGNYALLFLDIGSDTYYAYYAHYFLLSQYLSDLSLPFWSFKLGAGTSILTLYQFLYDPFSIIYFIAGPDKIAELIVWVFFFKTILSAVFMYTYCRYLNLSPQIATIAGLLWSFNGYLMLWGQHYYFGSWVIFCPLLFLGIERFWQERKWLLLLIMFAFFALDLVMFTQIAVFSSLYFIARFVSDWNVVQTRDLIKKIFGFSAIVFFGLSISAAFWMPQYHILNSSPRISPDTEQVFANIVREALSLNSSSYYMSMFSRIFSNNIEGVGSEYNGFRNYYESLSLFSGIIPLLLLPQSIVLLPKRQVHLSLVGLVFTILILTFPTFATIMNGLQYPSYRWGYGVIFFQIAFCAYIMQQAKQNSHINMVVLVFTTIVLCLASIFLTQSTQQSSMSLWLIPSAIIILAFLLAAWIKSQSKTAAYNSVLCVMVVLIYVEHNPTFNQRSVVSKNFDTEGSPPYFDEGLTAVRFLEAQDSGFYRLDRSNWILSLNDSNVQGFFGVDSYNSLNSPSYLSVLNNFDVLQPNLNVVHWSSIDHPYLADVMAVKYHLTKGDTKFPDDAVFLKAYESVNIFLRSSALPFGFTYSEYLLESEVNEWPASERERAMLYAAILDTEANENFEALKRLPQSESNDSARQKRRDSSLELLTMDEDMIIGRIKNDSPRILFLPIPYDQGWSAKLNDEPVELLRVNYGFVGVYLDSGESTLALRFVPPLLITGRKISILSVIILIMIVFYVRYRRVF